MISPAAAALNRGSAPHAFAAPDNGAGEPDGGVGEPGDGESVAGSVAGPPVAGSLEGTPVSCGAVSCGVIGGWGRTGAGPVRAAGAPACRAEAGGSPIAAAVRAAQQAAIAAATASRLPGIT
jgi:hypothetical protein